MSKILSYAELLTLGWTPKRVRHAVKVGQLTRLQHGWYADGGPPTDVDRIGAVLLAHPDAVASHLTAAALHGFRDHSSPVHVTVPHSAPARPGPGLVVHRTRRAVSPVVRGGLRVTSGYQTVLDLARWCPLDEGICLADAALAAGVCDRDGLDRRLPRLTGLPGARRARAVIGWCRTGAQSPMETRTRLALVRGGLPEPVLQHPVITRVATLHLDLAWPDQRVCVEYDGRDAHGGTDAFGRDRTRWRALAACGWDVHPVTAVDLRTPRALVAEVRAALTRRAARAA